MRKFLVPCSIAAILVCVGWGVFATRTIPIPEGTIERTPVPTPAALSHTFEPAPIDVEPLSAFGEEPEVKRVSLPAPVPEKVVLPTPTVASLPLAPRPGPRAREQTEAFAALPVGKVREVDFRMDESTRSRLTHREQRDQLRDWLLFTVVSEANLSADEINRVLFDVPTVRHGYMRPVANFEYGVTRSCVIGDGQVIALVPRSEPAQRKDHLAHIADEHRKNLGNKPRTVLVFEYQLDADHLTATLTRLADVPGKELFTGAYGYHEAVISNGADLKAFLAKVEDITHAETWGRDLLLGGRKLQSRAYRGLRVEDVAAVWQAQHKAQTQIAKVEARFEQEQKDLQAKWVKKEKEWKEKWEEKEKALRDTWQKKLDDLNERFGKTPRPPPIPGLVPFPGQAPAPRNPDQELMEALRGLGLQEPEKEPTEQEKRRQELQRWLGQNPGRFRGFGEEKTPFGVPRVLNQAEYDRQAKALQAGYEAEADRLSKHAEGEHDALVSGYKREAKTLQEEQARAFIDMKLLDHTGFSLDPAYDYEGLAKWFKEEGVKSLELILAQKDPPITREDIEKIQEGLNKHDELPLLQILDRLKNSNNLFAALLHESLEQQHQSFRFQKARYDGDLQGTEVGMILFYTDLLAKLWVSVDYGAPRDVVEDFRSGPDGGLSPIYRQETIEQPSTRLWFGPEERGYQIVNERKGMLFARRATRIFAASSNPLFPGVEVPASHQAERRMGWWNDHYEEVAAYEQEYERLNEYIKWSLIIAWLFADDNQARLAFLADVPVDHSNWFADWVKKHPELRYKLWDKVGFKERGYKGTTTEAIPILKSRPFKNFGEAEANWTVSGGVSGGRIGELKEHPVLPRELLHSQLRLSARGLDLKQLGQDGRRVTTLNGTTHTFDMGSPRRPFDRSLATMRVEPAPQSALRAPHGQLQRTPIERTVHRLDNVREVRLETRAGSHRLGSLSVKAQGNGFEVSHRTREMDLALAVGRDLSRLGGDPAEGLARDPRVELVYKTQEGTTLFKLRDQERWIKVAPEAKPNKDIADGWEARVADTSTGAKSYLLASVEARTAEREISRGEAIAIRLEPATDKRLAIVVEARGPPGKGPPPPRSTSFEMRDGPDRIPGMFDPATQTVVIRTNDLPQHLRDQPEHLAKLFKPADLNRLRGPPQEPGKPILLGSAEHSRTKPHRLIELLEAGRIREAADLIARDPVKAQRICADHLQQQLPHIDHLLGLGRANEALDVIDRTLKVNPDNPALLARKGLAQAERGRPEKAAEAINQILQGERNLAPLLVEIQRRKQNPNASALSRQVGTALDKGVHYRDMKAKGKTTAEGKVVVHHSADGTSRLDFEVRLTEAKLEPAKAKDVQGRDHLLVDDSAGLNNRDFSPATRQATLQQAVAGEAVTLQRLHNPDAALSVHPDVVVLPSGQRLRPAATPSAILRRFTTPLMNLFLGRGSMASKPGAAQVGAKKPGTLARIFLLLRKPKAKP